jgi:hypothetical protein
MDASRTSLPSYWEGADFRSSLASRLVNRVPFVIQRPRLAGRPRSVAMRMRDQATQHESSYTKGRWPAPRSLIGLLPGRTPSRAPTRVRHPASAMPAGRRRVTVSAELAIDVELQLVSCPLPIRTGRERGTRRGGRGSPRRAPGTVDRYDVEWSRRPDSLHSGPEPFTGTGLVEGQPQRRPRRLTHRAPTLAVVPVPLAATCSGARR